MLRKVIIGWFVVCHCLVAVELVQKGVSGSGWEASDTYQLLFPFLIGAATLLLFWRWPPPYLPERWPSLLRFALLAALFVLLEESCCCVAGTGTFEGGRSVASAYAIGCLALGGWAAGVYVAYRCFSLGLFEVAVLSGMAGWFLEGCLFQSLWQQMAPALFLLALPPLVAFHYVLLVLFALKEVESDTIGRKRWSRPVGYVAAVVVPLLIPGTLALLSR